MSIDETLWWILINSGIFLSLFVIFNSVLRIKQREEEENILIQISELSKKNIKTEYEIKHLNNLYNSLANMFTSPLVVQKKSDVIKPKIIKPKTPKVKKPRKSKKQEKLAENYPDTQLDINL